MNRKLGLTARDEIRHAMNGLVGKAAKAEAERLAELHTTSFKHIYRMTADMRQGTRRERSDKGRRRYDLTPGTDTFHAAALVIGGKLDPDQALLTAKANGMTELPSLAAFQELLRTKLGTAKQRRTSRRGFRFWEADHPLQLIQIDCTALKIRWIDEKTRRILKIEGIDKNHPQSDPSKLRVWQIMAVDDHSRRRFMRYVCTPRVTSRDMVDFCCELYCEWGIPWEVYTDNGSEFKGFFYQAERILSSIGSIASSGGYRLSKHKPGNSQASGKVENAHKWAEKMDRYIGLAQSKGLQVKFEHLNQFADAICLGYNATHVHRVTGMTALARWYATRVEIRTLPDTIIRAALLSDHFEARLDESMTVEFGGVKYRIPGRDAQGNKTPFVDFVGRRVKVVVPHSIDLIFITLPNGHEYEVAKVIATADKAGEFRTVADSTAQILTRELKEQYAADNRAAKDKRATTGEVYQVPYFNHEIAVPETNVTHFPQRELIVSAEEVNRVTPIPSAPVSEPGAVATGFNASSTGVAAPAHVGYIGKPLTYWQAVSEFKDRFNNPDDCKRFLTNLYGTDAELPITQIEAAIDGRNQERRLKVAS